MAGQTTFQFQYDMFTQFSRLHSLPAQLLLLLMFVLFTRLIINVFLNMLNKQQTMLQRPDGGVARQTTHKPTSQQGNLSVMSSTLALSANLLATLQYVLQPVAIGKLECFWPNAELGQTQTQTEVSRKT